MSQWSLGIMGKLDSPLEKAIRKKYRQIASVAVCLGIVSLGGLDLVTPNPLNGQTDIPLSQSTTKELRDEADLQLRLGGRAERKGYLEKADRPLVRCPSYIRTY